MQSGPLIMTSIFCIGSTLQQDPHRHQMAISSSMRQRCVTVLIICSAAVIGAGDQHIHSVHVSGFSSLKQIPAGL